jgi:hypothetical protein
MTSFWENVTKGEGQASYYWHAMPPDQKVNKAEEPTYLNKHWSLSYFIFENIYF